MCYGNLEKLLADIVRGNAGGIRELRRFLCVADIQVRETASRCDLLQKRYRIGKQRSVSGGDDHLRF